MKRLFFILLLSSFMIRCFFTVTAAADELSAAAPDEIAAGQLFSTVISIQTETPLSAIQLEISASDDLSFRSVKLCQLGDSHFYEDKNCVKMILLADDAFVSGELAELDFLAENEALTERSTITITAVDAAGTGFEECPITESTASIEVNIKQVSSSSKNTSAELSPAVSAASRNECLASSLKSSSSKTVSKETASPKTTSSESCSSASTTTSSKKTTSRKDNSSKNSTSKTSEYEESSSLAFSHSDTQLNLSPVVYIISGSAATLIIIGALRISFKIGQYSVSRRK